MSRLHAGPRKLPHCDRLLVIVGDIEMGAGGSFDDFPQSDFLGELILSYNSPPFHDLAVDLVFNGDTFDLLKTSYVDEYPRHITRDVALAKMARISAAHPRFFEAVRLFLAHDQADRRVFFVDGNHDAELRFPEIQRLVQTLCGESERVLFPGYELTVGRVHIEHGHQQDRMFRMEPDRSFIEFDGNPILNLSWGAAALLDTVIPLQSLFCFHDRLKPKNQVFDLMPEVKELLVGLFWQYWTRDYWRDFFRSRDPTKKLRWTMLKEVAWRFGSKDVDVSISPEAEKGIKTEGDFDLFVMGHLHEPAWKSYGHRKIIQAGCFRNEYMMLEEGKRLQQIPTNHVEVFMRGDTPVVSHMVEMEAPPAPQGYVPESIFDVLPEVKRRLEETGAKKENRGAREAQEAQEAQETKEAAEGEESKSEEMLAS